MGKNATSFQPGQVANPRGRPPVGKSIAEYIRKLGGENGKIYVDKLHELAAGNHNNVTARLAAIDALLNRGFGKPPQDVNVKGQVDSRTTVIHEYHDTPPSHG